MCIYLLQNNNPKNIYIHIYTLKNALKGFRLIDQIPLSKFQWLRASSKITTICLEITPCKIQKPHPTPR